MNLSNKKLQEKCWEDAQATADWLNEAIVYDDQEDKFFTESKYKTNSHLFWYYPTIKE